MVRSGGWNERMVCMEWRVENGGMHIMSGWMENQRNISNYRKEDKTIEQTLYNHRTNTIQP